MSAVKLAMVPSGPDLGTVKLAATTDTAGDHCLREHAQRALLS